MLRFTAVALLAAPGWAAAQPPEADRAAEYVRGRRNPDGGYGLSAAAPKSTLRATGAAVRALKYLKAELPAADRQKSAEFVASCFDPATGGCADSPGGPPTVATTAGGVMAAVELGVPRDRFGKALGHLKTNAVAFEDVRLAAAAVEAWGVTDCPFDLRPWADHGRRVATDGGPRELASGAATALRLGFPLAEKPSAAEAAQRLRDGQRPDGGWAKTGAAGSDLETTYRVMRALKLLKAVPADPGRVRGFVASCRNPDGGYGVSPGGPSSVAGVYYAAIVAEWLDRAK